MIGRTVRLRVDRVLWSAPDAPRPAPATLEMPVAGWIFNNNDGQGTRTFALRHSSRIETGHTYVKAIEWIDGPCSDDPNRGKWDGLGSGDVIPFDGGVLGAGEFEGRVQTLDEAEARARTLAPVARFLRDQLVGEPVETLIAALSTTSPSAETIWSPECDPDDR